MERTADVVVVGAGIAGSALAKITADAGLSTLVLERQLAYRDRVRGEYMHPWGVAEARRLGVEHALLSAGGMWVTHAVGYDEVVPPETAEANPLSFTALRPDMPGAMDIGHPAACQALADLAETAGASVVRGVGDVEITAGSAPAVRYELDGVEHDVRCRLIVGADGRASSVRRQLGYQLHQTEARTMGGGMLVEGLTSWPTDRAALGSEKDLHYFVFPRGGGVARLYQLHAIDQRSRFTGPDRQQEMLDSFRMACLPLGDDIAASTPAGPVAFYPWNDSWTDTPCAPGVVLVGDAAGWNDPIIGEGLSIALRDARTVGEVITGTSEWSEAAFAGYATERAERMRRLRICAELETDLRCTFTPAGRARRLHLLRLLPNDPMLAAATVVAGIAGPEVAPLEAFTTENIDRIRALT
jgi:2-polyprenyl-6-methoxyphenol hydroxylase-like FAD-dependent oxidoreductase